LQASHNRLSVCTSLDETWIIPNDSGETNMFAVIDTPCSPKKYNSLPGVVEADDAIKLVQRSLDQLVDQGSEACLSTPFTRGQIGAFLLHKHWEVQESECMIERPAPQRGKPALITSAQRFSSPATFAPSRFKIDPSRRVLQALEFSSDQFVVEAWRALVAHPTFLESACQLIGDSGLADQVGFAIFDRATVPVAEGEQMVEENWDQKSVLSARVLTDDEQMIVIRTGWPFVSAREADPTAASCIGYCMSAGAPHCRHHASVLMIAPPPVCMRD
jgi:hypothetical protein